MNLIFVSAMMFFRCSLSSMNLLECVSMNNQRCKVRPEIANVNSNEPVVYPFSIKTSKCSGSCNNVNDSYAKVCVPDVVKNINIKVFNLISITNETRHIEWHETCKCKFGLDSSVSNNKQCWNEDICRCECKELIDKGVCDKGFIWNIVIVNVNVINHYSNYSDYSNCKSKKKLVDKLVEECTENVDEVKIASENEHKNKCSSCTLYIVLFLIIFTTNIRIATYFVYYKYMSRNEENVSKYDYICQAKNYCYKWEKSKK